MMQTGRSIKTAIIASGLLGLCSGMVSTVQAGGFAIREQSAVGLGSAFAGIGAGGSLGSMYWNGATITQFEGMNTESNYSAIFPDTVMTTTVPFPETVELGKTGLLGASYANFQVSEKLFLGLGMNAPYGLATEPDNPNWGGQFHARTSKIFSLNFNPVAAYKLSDSLSISAGAQLQYVNVRLKRACPPAVCGAVLPPFPTMTVEGNDIGLGFTVGVLFEPSDWTSIGFGYRSNVSHTLEGDFSVPFGSLPISAKLKTPDTATLSIRQNIAEGTRLLATAEWSGWDSVQELRVNGTPFPFVQDFSWENSWFYSVGLEHDVTDALTVRGGFAKETSPVPDATRTPALPDNDRRWFSVGASYKWSEATTLDFAYSHIKVDDAPIALAAPTPLVGDVETSINVISAGMRMKW